MILGYPNSGDVSLPQDYASSRSIFWRSFRSAKRHPKLVLLPLAASLLFCARSLVATPLSLRLLASVGLAGQPPIAIEVCRLLAMFGAIFLTGALFHELARVYSNERPSIRQGIRYAASRLAPILSWSVVMFSVGLAFQLCVDPFGKGPQQIFLRVAIAAVWVAEMFAIPVLLRGRLVNPIAVVQRSWAAARPIWIELMALFLSLILLQVSVMVVAQVFLGLLPESDARRVLGFVAVCSFLTALYLTTSIYLCALYIYATEGVMPDPLRPGDLDTVWEIKAH